MIKHMDVVSICKHRPSNENLQLKLLQPFRSPLPRTPETEFSIAFDFHVREDNP